MTDTLPNRNIVSQDQENEAFKALTMFERFQFGTVITTPKLAESLAETSIKNLTKEVGIDFFISKIDFNDPDSIEKFVNFWQENENLLYHLQGGYLDPRDIVPDKHPAYPIFLFINPTNLDYVSDNYLENDKSELAMSQLHKITKFGRVHVIVTPDRLVNTGTNWPKVPQSYQDALSNPQDLDAKIELAKYFYARSGLTKLGLLERVEKPSTIYTPTEEAIQKVI